jgi:hypothetical protein
LEARVHLHQQLAVVVERVGHVRYLASHALRRADHGGLHARHLRAHVEDGKLVAVPLVAQGLPLLLQVVDLGLYGYVLGIVAADFLLHAVVVLL